MSDIDKKIAKLEELEKKVSSDDCRRLLQSCEDSNILDLIFAMRNALPDLIHQIKYTFALELEFNRMQGERDAANARAEKAEEQLTKAELEIHRLSNEILQLEKQYGHR